MVKPVFKIIYDNYKIKNDMQTAHGFSCFIELGGKNILFDTGSEGDILVSNMEKMHISPENIDIIVLSHNHWDHVDGLPKVLEKNNKAKVYVLKSFSGGIRDNIEKYKAPFVDVVGPLEILKGVHSTGEMGTGIKEQSLILDTSKGLVVVTGCAHQGVIQAIKKAKETVNRNVLLVFGGFHLMGEGRQEIKKVIDDFRALGVEYAGPSHCTGEEAIKMFAEVYKTKFVKIGIGKVIKLDSLE